MVVIFLHFYHFDDIDGVHLLLLYVQDKNKNKRKRKELFTAITVLQASFSYNSEVNPSLFLQWPC